MNRPARKRILVTCLGLVVCFTGLSARLLYVQVSRHEHYLELGRRAHETRKILSSSRGPILDYAGQVLASNEPVKTVIVDATIVKEPELLADLLADPLKLDKTELHAKFVEESYGPAPRVVPEDPLRARHRPTAVKMHVAMVGRVGVLAPDVG